MKLGPYGLTASRICLKRWKRDKNTIPCSSQVTVKGFWIIFLEKVHFVECFFRKLTIWEWRGGQPNESKYTAFRFDVTYTVSQWPPNEVMGLVLITYAAGALGFNPTIWSIAYTPLKTHPSFFFNMLLICKLFISSNQVKYFCLG